MGSPLLFSNNFINLKIYLNYMAIVWSDTVHYINDFVNYLTFQNPIYVSITFTYIIECLLLPLVYLNIEIF